MISSVEMINWRAYDNRVFKFTPGITFLLGANGSGKSSVLEAICYGLTGEAAMFDSKTRSKLLRNPQHNALVSLTFESKGNNYFIHRAQSPRHAADAKLLRGSDGKILATTHSQCTQQIVELMGVSPDFLRRIIYMAEGDVSRFINEPPGEALESQIRQVLGLTQLDQFLIALDKSKKQLKQRIESLQELSYELARLKIHTQSQLQIKLSSGEDALARLLENFEDNKAQEIEVKSLLSNLERLRLCVDAILNIDTLTEKGWNDFVETPLLEYVVRLDRESDRLSKERYGLELQKARLEGEKQAQKKILAILEPYLNSNETIPCPICKKPMTESEWRSILSVIRKNNFDLDSKIERIENDANHLGKELEEMRSSIAILKDLLNLIDQGNLPKLNTTSTFNQITESISLYGEKISFLEGLDVQRQEIQRRLGELQNQQAEYLSIQNRLSESGFSAPEEVNDTLVALEVRSLSVRSASQASQKTLVTQRNSDLQSIYSQIAQLWGAFSGEQAWQIALDERGLPTLENELGRKFDMLQLSGGEKTALLIMLHTIIAHNFSQSDFILVDEPLEHLDPINRRSLIRFLVQSYHRGMFKQAIVATFEESLIRKYLSEEGVNIVAV